MDLRETGAVDTEQHWYYQSKIVPFIKSFNRLSESPKLVLDVGAGSGFFGIELVRDRPEIKLICVDPNYSDKEIRDDGRISFVRESHNVEADLYIFADVLEHVENDVELLTEYLVNANPGSTVLISVPAFNSLWSKHDEFLGHYRRYKLRDICAVAEAAGLTVLEKKYLFSSIFPITWMARKFQRNSQPESDLRSIKTAPNWILKKMLRLEHQFTSNRMFGVTAYVSAQKVV